MTQQDTANISIGDLAKAAAAQAAQAAPEPPKMVKYLNSSTVGLLKLSPKNPQVRAMVQAELKHPIPDEADTFEKICEWFLTIADKAKPVPAKAIPEFFTLVSYKRREWGTCNFGQDKTYDGGWAIEPKSMQQILEDSNTLEEAAQRVSDWIENNIDEYCRTHNTSYDEHEINDSETVESNILPRRFEKEIREWLAVHHPEELERLDG